jgi:beta-glucanase (GH16 family)
VIAFISRHACALAIVLLGTVRIPPVIAEEAVTPESRGYHLAWADEFDGGALDSAKWHTSYAPKVHPIGCNNEKQVYAPENVALRDGQLVLRAERKARDGMPFTSGMVASHEKFSQQYGWFEARMKLPRGRGLWPAFWLLPATMKWPPEIDIMEHKGRIPDRVWLTLHLPQPGTWQPKSDGKEWSGPDFTADFHTFAVEWEPGAMRWYVDGVERHSFPRTTPDVPMYVILNLAVGGDWDGDPDAATAFPSEMLVEWVRVYRRP